MAKSKKETVADDPAVRNARLVTTPEEKAKAAQWFQRARELGDKRQFDYAIEYYVHGLEFWPDAVEEACKPLHACAVARRQFGGKKPGLKDTMKRSMSDKEPKQAFMNAMWLFGHEPDNLSYMEGAVRSAIRLRADDAAHWAAGVYVKALKESPKAGSKQFMQLTQQLDELGDRSAGRGEAGLAISVYQLCVDALNAYRQRVARDQAVEEALRDTSSKLTILKGKYKDGDSYRDSIADLDEQRDIHDEQRSVQSDVRLDELIAKAYREYEQQPDDQRLVKNVVELLCRREREDEEMRAITILVNEYKRTGVYRWKHLADDTRMKQLSRKTRELERQGHETAVKEHQVTQLRFELSVFKERVDRYPTDNRIKFEFGLRNFRAGRFDDAIPLFQAARSDPKNRASCGFYLGRCFFRKGFQSEAIATLEEAIANHELQNDELAKSMLYWLGRAQEASGRQSEARNSYGKLMQLDYNYKDVRARLSGLPSSASA
jgi:tetratricopeptide (TPR) repeat protein